MTKTFVIIFVNYFFFFLLVTGQDAEQSTEGTSESEDPEVTVYSECQDSEVGYVKLQGFTCCLNQTLENPFNEIDDIFEEKCSQPLHKVDSDDLPTAMWRKHACILKTSGAVEKDLATFKGYMKFMTMNYTEPLKSKILKSTGECKGADQETDEIKRLKMFHQCMYEYESKVCQVANKEAGVKQETCKPGGFPHCCKNQLIPYPVPVVHLDTENVNLTDRLQCSKSYIDRQKVLDPEIKKGEEEIENHHNYQMTGKLSDRCVAACRRRGIHFTTKEALKIDMEELKKSMFTLFSATTRKDLMVLLDKYTGVKNYHIMENDNTTISIKEAIKIMATKNEVTQIHIYCNVQEFISELEVAALDDYCFDEKYAKRNWMDNSAAV